MNQTFKKKAIAVGLAAAFVVGSAGVAGVAFANQFVDTTVVNTNSNSVNIQAKASQSPGNTVTFTEASQASIQTGAAGELVFALDNGARFTGATVTTAVGTSGFTVNAPAVVISAPTLVQNAYHPLFTFKFNGTYYCVKVMDTAGTSIASTTTKAFISSGADASAAISSTTYSAGTAVATANTVAYLAAAIVTEINAITGASSATSVNHATPASATGVVFAPAATATPGAASAVGAFKVISDLAAVSTSVTNSLGSNVTATAGYPTINSSGQVVLRMAAQSTGVGSVALSSMLIDASASSVGTPVTMTLTGLGTGTNGTSNTTRVANVSAGALTATLSGTALSTTNSAVVTLPSFTVAERFAGDVAVAAAGTDAATTKVLQFKLSSNAKFTSFSLTSGNAADKLGYTTVTLASTTLATTAATTFLAMKRDGTVVQITVPVVSTTTAGDLINAYSTALQANGFVLNTDYTVSGNNTITFNTGRGAFATSANGATGGTGNLPTFSTEYGYGISDAGVVSIPVVTVSDSAATYTVGGSAALSSTDTGALTVTASSGSIASSALTLGTISQATAGSGTTTLAFTDVAPTTGMANVYTGRSSNAVFNTGDYLKFAESTKAQVPSGSLVTMTLNKGTYVTAPAFTAIGGAPTFGTVTTNGSAALVSTTAASSAATSADFVKVDTFTVDLSSVSTPGDLTVAMGGNPSITSTAAVKVASIIDATTASVSGSTPSVATSGTITMPDILITENAATALSVGSSNYITIAAPSAQLSAFDLTGASVKALKADGTDVTTTIFGSATVVPTACTTPATGTACVQVLPVTASSTSTGPVTIKISGMKGTVGANASGDIKLTIGGSGTNTGVDITSTSTTATTAISSNVGAKPTKATIKIGSAIGSTVSVPAPTVTGTATSQSISASVVPASADLGVPGQVFVIAYIPQIPGFLSLSGSGAWTTMNLQSSVTSSGTTTYTTGLNGTQVYFNGGLTVQNTIPVVSNMSLQGFDGSTLYIGYGKNSFDTNAAFNNMVTNGTYRIACTVKNGICTAN